MVSVEARYGNGTYDRYPAVDITHAVQMAAKDAEKNSTNVARIIQIGGRPCDRIDSSKLLRWVEDAGYAADVSKEKATTIAARSAKWKPGRSTLTITIYGGLSNERP